MIMNYMHAIQMPLKKPLMPCLMRKSDMITLEEEWLRLELLREELEGS